MAISVARNIPYQNNLDWVFASNPEGRVNWKVYMAWKRALDLFLVFVTAPLWAPLMGFIAFLIKIDSPKDPVFFLQKRTGKGGRRFKMFKFRTMVTNAEELKVQLAAMNELKWPDFKISNDPRITRIGKYLRKSSLDELPQILNVIVGEMSLVGPRPTSFARETYSLWHTQRLDVVPGITGLWQVIGRGSTEFDERLRLDITYIEHRCLWLDAQILFRTIFAMLEQRGAY